MTATVSSSLHARSAAKQGRSFLERSWEWLWLPAALRHARQIPPLPASAKQWAARARSSFELARRLLSVEMRAEDQAQASANELYRNATYAALLALTPAAPPNEGNGYSEAVWDRLGEALSLTDFGRPVTDTLATSLRRGSPLYFAELPADEQVAIGAELSALADALLRRAEFPERGATAIYVKRVWRVAALFMLVTTALVGCRSLYLWRADLALHKPWKASSTLAKSGGCRSPAQDCGQLLGTFFHTEEEKSPWLEIDLETARAIRQVEVQNRTDCCADRARPLTIEVSTDHHLWQTVGRQDEEFSTWNARFPTVQARWVRIRALKTTFLHLKRVRVY